MTRDPIAVVGASLAGLNAAVELRRRGFEGRLSIIGDEPHYPYDRPPLSKELLRGEWLEAEAALPFDAAHLQAEWHLGHRAVSLAAQTRELDLDDGTRRQFPGGIVLATGATPRRLPGVQLQGVHVLRSLSDLAGLRQSLAKGPAAIAVIGAGFIGQEVSASCRMLGISVTLVEPAAPARHVLGDDVARHVAELHRAQGVDVRLGVAVAALEGDDGRLSHIRLSNGDSLAVSTAVVGIGVVPNVEWLQNSGLTLDDGVVCDATCCAAEGIVAAGDVARWPNARYGEMRRIEHWDNAVRQSVHAARRLLASPGDREFTAAYAPVPWFWSDQYGSKLQLIGSTLRYDEVHIVRGDNGRYLALYRRADRLTAVFGINQAKRILSYRRLLNDNPSWAHALAALEPQERTHAGC
ncbi:MAG: FAD-dependent oxidoreductase [Pseudomonadota bacterium]|nr:FAD-dependent oxidoreductase [Pseudomonadota bacterium]